MKLHTLDNEFAKKSVHFGDLTRISRGGPRRKIWLRKLLKSEALSLAHLCSSFIGHKACAHDYFSYEITISYYIFYYLS